MCDLEKIIYNTLSYWEKKDYKSTDIGDIMSSSLYLNLNIYKRQIKLGKYLYSPLDQLVKRYPNILRSLFKLDRLNEYPQAYAMIIRGVLNIYPQNYDPKLKKLAVNLSDRLMKLNSPYVYNLAWGQPFNWPSRDLMKKNIPRTTVTSQVAEAFLDLYELFGDDKHLEVANSSCLFFIEDLNYAKDTEGDFCLSYTTEDDYKVHNASMMAASVMCRVYGHTNKQEYLEFAKRLINFTMKHQNLDGSWYYSNEEINPSKTIDNYHTGFVLESLSKIPVSFFKDQEQEIQRALNRGADFYVENLFTTEGIPKYRHNKLYPIDIQSCMQSIITLHYLRDHEIDYGNLMKKVVKYSIENFYDEQGRFYYRQYKNRLDKSSYLRWGDSWAIFALSLLYKTSIPKVS